MAVITTLTATIAVTFLAAVFPAYAGDTNNAFSPCTDTRVQRSDGFTFGLAFASKDKFFYNNNNSVQLSPCDSRLSLSNSNSQISLFRPKIDEISLLSVNSTSFVAVLEFQKGRLQNLYWKRDGCSKCPKNSKAVCLNNQDCAIPTSTCKSHGGPVDCSLGIQLAFSGTDKHLSALNSWYEVKNLRQYSLYGLYSNLRSSLTSQYDKFF
ncbi:unnamed protein product [Trifolium pratense]|uniref:Uncharacterized protein n=1 Tax=Trifolium pratense TaxID=57577 RepID=A0ACB0LWK4_TRIPR|nr:unnamed protein product [Trifolium pratense]